MNAAVKMTTGPSVLNVSDAIGLTREQALALHNRHLGPRSLQIYQFLGLDDPLMKASGSYFYTANGTRYADFVSGWGALNFGHNPPQLVAALNQVTDRPNLAEGINALAAALAHNISLIAPGNLTRSYLANTGTEVVDAAIKMARAATGRHTIISCRGSYHGRSIGALSAIDREDYRKNFEPLLPDVRFVDFGDPASLDDALHARDAALFLVEPVQAEAGIYPAPDGYLTFARARCTQYGTLLAFDEIQTGMGRTGRVFAAEHEGVTPDCLLMGKSIGGGVAALSALATTDALWKASDADGPRSPFHHSTYGGNTQSCAVGIEAIRLLLDERLSERAQESGDYLMSQLRSLQAKHSRILEVRGKGLMIGIEFSPPSVSPFGHRSTVEGDASRYLFCGLIVRQLIRKHRIFTAVTAHNANVLRVAPPLNITREELDSFVAALDATLDSLKNFKTAVMRALPDITKFFLNGKSSPSID